MLVRVPYRLKKIFWKYFPYRAKQFYKFRNEFTGKSGLEIGGLSSYFQHRGSLPIYDCAESIDNVIIAPHCVSEEYPKQGYLYQFNPKKECGYQFVQEASDLKSIEDHSYDFVISSHVLEHFSNPLKALLEWRRVLVPKSYSLHLVPIAHNCFDHLRPITTFDHLLSDYQFSSPENDLTHLVEVLEYHDHSKNTYEMSKQDFQSWCQNNEKHRIMHHHVFDAELLKRCFLWAGYEVETVEELDPVSYLIIAKS